MDGGGGGGPILGNDWENYKWCTVSSNSHKRTVKLPTPDDMRLNVQNMEFMKEKNSFKSLISKIKSIFEEFVSFYLALDNDLLW